MTNLVTRFNKAADLNLAAVNYVAAVNFAAAKYHFYKNYIFDNTLPHDNIFEPGADQPQIYALISLILFWN